MFPRANTPSPKLTITFASLFPLLYCLAAFAQAAYSCSPDLGTVYQSQITCEQHSLREPERERSGEMRIWGLGTRGTRENGVSLSSPPSLCFAFPSLSLVKLSCPSFLGFRRIPPLSRDELLWSSPRVLRVCVWCSCEFEVGREVCGSEFFEHSSSLSFGAPNEPENRE